MTNEQTPTGIPEAVQADINSAAFWTQDGDNDTVLVVKADDVAGIVRRALDDAAWQR